jgi:FADH2 O2-dependent halogenase
MTTNERDTYDIAIVGSGFAGSLLAMIARRLGRSVVLIERGKHPRVVIGESSTPLTNLLLEELTTRYDLPSIRPLAKWGSWQKAHPEIACGLKRGFTFYHHNLEDPNSAPIKRGRQLLVAASPHDEISDTHWYRADFDHLFVREALNMGVEYLDETELFNITESPDEITLTGKRHDREIKLAAKFVIDASGPRGFLHRALGILELELPDYPATQALYTHFSGIGRLEDQQRSKTREQPPYPVDDAAVHHVFEGGWIWVLQFNNGITSAGIAATDSIATRLNLSEGAAAWNRIVQSIPALKEQFAKAKAERDFVRIPRLSFRSATIAGKRWALLPSAAGFVDPLLSTGFPLTLLGVDRLARIIGNHWDSPEFAARLQTYAAQTDSELVATGRLIASLYANMANFSVFLSLSLLYFAAASFSETVRRLKKPHLAQSFLLHDHAAFGSALARICDRALRLQSREEADQLSKDILREIEAFNVAGLGDPQRRNWYPVDPQDLFNSAAKVEASREEISQMLRLSGFLI